MTNKNKKPGRIYNRVLSSIVLILVIFGSLVLSGCGSNPLEAYRLDLEIWGFRDESDVYDSFINEYQLINPHIGEIKYRKLSIETYKQELLSALAAGNGPDIFLIQNTWLPSFIDKLEPAPQTVVTESDVHSQFVDTVSDDFISEGQVYALPLTMGSLALYYNKDMLNAAGITTPPKTWNEFIENSKAMTSIDENGNITRSGAALGTAYNINRSTDILTMLMLQNNVKMVDDIKASAKFDQGVENSNGETSMAGEEALQFYTQFANPGLTSYSWNSRMHYSIDAFYEGATAMMINYPWHTATIRSKNPKLNFGVAQVPQLDPSDPVNYPNYWGYAIARNKVAYMSDGTGEKKTQLPNELRIHEAWEFLRYLTMKNNGTIRLENAVSKKTGELVVTLDPAVEYAKNTEQPAARRDIIETQKSDPLLGSFAYGNLIAKSWYQADPAQTEGIFAEMIDSVNKGNATVHDAIVLAASRVTQLMRK